MLNNINTHNILTSETPMIMWCGLNLYILFTKLTSMIVKKYSKYALNINALTITILHGQYFKKKENVFEQKKCMEKFCYYSYLWLCRLNSRTLDSPPLPAILSIPVCEPPPPTQSRAANDIFIVQLGCALLHQPCAVLIARLCSASPTMCCPHS